MCRRAARWTAFEQPGISTTIMRDSQVMKAHPLLRSVGHTQLVIAGSILLGLIMGGGLTMLLRAPHSSLKTCIIRELGRQPVSMVSVQLLCAEQLTTEPLLPGLEVSFTLLEFVREHQAGLQSFRSMRRIDARRKNASALRLRFSQSLASLRQRLSQAMVRSTTQRRGSTTNPLA